MSETGLTSSDFAERGEPLALFGEWLRDATQSEPNDPNAVALAREQVTTATPLLTGMTCGIAVLPCSA